MAQSKSHHYQPAKISPREKLEMLTKIAWNYKDVCNYFQTNDNKAFQIIKAVREKYGLAPFFTNHILIKDLLDYFGTTIERETATLEKAMKYDTRTN